MKKICLLLFILIECMKPIFARDITGRIIDESRQPLAFVNIVCLSLPDSSFIQGTISKDDGSFELNTLKKNCTVRISSIGYVTQYKKCMTDDLGNIILKSDAMLLGEVTVKGSRSMYKMKDGYLSVRVQGTPLSKEQTLNDVLEHIPGVIKQADGTLAVFGSGSPEIYISGRKATSSELQHIDVKQIDNVQLITNPGAKYGGTVGAVLEVRLQRKDEGLFSVMQVSDEQSETNTNKEDVTLGWVDKKLNVSAYYGYEDNRYNVSQPQKQILDMDDGQYSFWSDRKGKNKAYLNNSEIKFDYQFSKNQNAGFQWENNWSRGGRYESSTQYSLQPGESESSFFAEGKDHTTNYTGHINMFHVGKWSEHFSNELYLDYVHDRSNVSQPVTETENNENILVHTRSHSNYDVYSGRLVMVWAFNKSHSLSWGAEYSLVDGGGNLASDASFVSQADYGNREEKGAGYVEYRGSSGKWNWQVGLRYEHLNSRYTDKENISENMQHIYDQWFPSFTVGMQQEKWAYSLQFSTQTLRPSFRQLSSATYYVNRFFYQEGNPKLQPQASYLLTWRTTWKDFNGSLTYQYTKDHLNNDFNVPEDKPLRIISTYSNFNHISHLRAALVWQHNFGWWKPNVSGNFDQQYFKVEYLGKDLNCNGNSWNVSFNNYFVLPHNYQLSLTYYFSNGGMVNDCHFRSYQNWGLGVTKSFLDNKLTVSAKASDLFHQYLFREKIKLGKVNFAQTEDYKLWYYRLTVSFHFNKLKSKYRGVNAAQQEMNRL